MKIQPRTSRALVASLLLLPLAVACGQGEKEAPATPSPTPSAVTSSATPVPQEAPVEGDPEVPTEAPTPTEEPTEKATPTETAAPEPKTAPVQKISPEEVDAAIQKGGFTVVDVRESNDLIDSGFLEVAVSVPLSHLQARPDAWKDAWITADMKLLVYGDNPNQAAEASRILKAQGFSVVNGGEYKNLEKQGIDILQ